MSAEIEIIVDIFEVVPRIINIHFDEIWINIYEAIDSSFIGHHKNGEEICDGAHNQTHTKWIAPIISNYEIIKNQQIIKHLPNCPELCLVLMICCLKQSTTIFVVWLQAKVLNIFQEKTEFYTTIKKMIVFKQKFSMSWLCWRLF